MLKNFKKTIAGVVAAVIASVNVLSLGVSAAGPFTVGVGNGYYATYKTGFQYGSSINRTLDGYDAVCSRSGMKYLQIAACVVVGSESASRFDNGNINNMPSKTTIPSNTKIVVHTQAVNYYDGVPVIETNPQETTTSNQIVYTTGAYSYDSTGIVTAYGTIEYRNNTQALSVALSVAGVS